MINISTRTNPPNLAQVISDLPRNLRGPATEEAAKYLIGNGSHGLSHYPNYTHISRAAAYGQTFVSDRQRRKVMAMIRSGEILPGYPRRTGNTQRGWIIVGSGASSKIRNDTAGAFYSHGDPGQAKLNEMGGWRRIGLIIASNERGMLHAVDLRIAREIRERGL